MSTAGSSDHRGGRQRPAVTGAPAVKPRFLLAVNLLLLLTAAVSSRQLYRSWTAVPPAIGPVAIRQIPPAPTARAPESKPAASWAVIAERSLFSPTRTETAPVPPTSLSTIPPRLYGVVLGSGQDARAYLEDPRTRKVFGYGLGDAVGESRVHEIQPDRVVLRRGDYGLEVRLWDPSKPKAPPALGAPASSGSAATVPPVVGGPARAPTFPSPTSNVPQYFGGGPTPAPRPPTPEENVPARPGLRTNSGPATSPAAAGQSTNR